jgi:hypothetical protein
MAKQVDVKTRHSHGVNTGGDREGREVKSSDITPTRIL